MIPSVFAAVVLLLYLAIAGVLMRKYVRTRDAGLIWLGVAVVIWPMVTRLLDGGERVLIDRLIRHQFVGFYPFSLVDGGTITTGSLVLYLQLVQQTIGVCLLLIAVVYLYKGKNGADLRLATTGEKIN
ncbi:MAG TPA: hypothetical protein VIY49_33270 [Bryobacteraceae bacterium]